MNKSLSFFFSFFRLTCLAITFFSLVVTTIWLFVPTVIERIDDAIRSRYVAYYNTRLQQIIHSSEFKTNQSYFDLLDFLEDIESIQKEDRIAPIKSRAYRAFVAMARKSDASVEDTLQWYDQWMTFDRNNINVPVQKALFLTSIQQHNEAITILSELFEIFPESDTVARAYAHTLLAASKPEQVVKVLSKFRQQRVAKPHGRWRTGWRYFDDSSFRERVWADVKLQPHENNYSLQVSVEAMISPVALTFEIPDAIFGWCLTEPSMTLALENKSETFRFQQFPPTELSDDLAWNGKFLEISTGHNSFNWQLPEALIGQELVGFEFSSVAVDCSDDWVEQLTQRVEQQLRMAVVSSLSEEKALTPSGRPTS